MKYDNSTNFTRDGIFLTNTDVETIIEDLPLGNEGFEGKELSSKDISIIINGAKERIQRFSFSSYFKRYIYRKEHLEDTFEQDIFNIPVKEFNNVVSTKFDEYFKNNNAEAESTFPLKLNTVKSWINDKVNPDRNKVMLLGFIFNEPADVVERELIKKGLGEQGFNYKDIEENALAFCLNNKLSYSEYLKIIEDIQKYIENNIENILDNLDSDTYTKGLSDKVNAAENKEEFENIVKYNISSNITTIWNVILKMLRDGEDKFLSLFNNTTDKEVNKTVQKKEARKIIKDNLDNVKSREKWIDKCFKGNKIFDVLYSKAESKNLKLDFEKCIFKSLTFIDSSHSPLLKILSTQLYNNFNLGSYSAYYKFTNKYNEIIKFIRNYIDPVSSFMKLETYKNEDDLKEFSLINKYLFGELNIGNADLKEKSYKSSLKKHISNYLSPDYLSKILSRKSNISREQFVILIAIKEFLFLYDDNEDSPENVVELQENFCDEADSCLGNANMQMLDTNKPLDYILYMCCLFNDPLSTYVEIMLEVFETDRIKKEFDISEAYLKSLISKMKGNKFNESVINNIIHLGKAYKNEKMYDIAKEKFEEALKIMDEMISLKKEKFKNFDTLYSEIKNEL